MLTDGFGAEVSYSDRDAVDEFTTAARKMLGFEPDPVGSMLELLRQHPDFVMARCLVAGRLSRRLRRPNPASAGRAVRGARAARGQRERPRTRSYSRRAPLARGRLVRRVAGLCRCPRAASARSVRTAARPSGGLPPGPIREVTRSRPPGSFPTGIRPSATAASSTACCRSVWRSPANMRSPKRLRSGLSISTPETCGPFTAVPTATRCRARSTAVSRSCSRGEGSGAPRTIWPVTSRGISPSCTSSARSTTRFSRCTTTTCASTTRASSWTCTTAARCSGASR